MSIRMEERCLIIERTIILPTKDIILKHLISKHPHKIVTIKHLEAGLREYKIYYTVENLSVPMEDIVK